MTRNTTDEDSHDIIEEEHDKPSLFGHQFTIHNLKSEHNGYQLCFQWCKQQQEQEQEQGPTKNCTMLCFKRKVNDMSLNSSTTDTSNADTTSTLDTTPTTSATYLTDTFTKAGYAFKDILSSYVANPLKRYSIITVKGTDITTSDYINVQQHEQQQEFQRYPRIIHEINIGEKTESALDNGNVGCMYIYFIRKLNVLFYLYIAEWMLKKTHQLSKQLINTWQTKHSTFYNKWIGDFNYSDTIFIVKDRASKMMDVARGKYDDHDNNNNNKEHNNDNDTSDIINDSDSDPSKKDS
ncbi:uncharacterized protein BX664DRAFT_342517 [Halteromyces radiatus]|uniref:uncharacterized protein n=1 Tax=Halteromyces radiatus TaxID=101107 RepID=UPI0022203BCD|nr:uncharacterized protein BX664DRAFT_342517 [Halteromyces radiatus]KAI8078704.1 hypothetical protein BX664DRAFT_342517 [Halteromyces radiatus]